MDSNYVVLTSNWYKEVVLSSVLIHPILTLHPARKKTLAGKKDLKLSPNSNTTAELQLKV